jgi:kynureninase
VISTTRKDCAALDADDPFKGRRDDFAVPEGTIYLDGNSLGLMPKAVTARVTHALDVEWSRDLITSWNKHGWFALANRVAGKIAPLIGAGDETVAVTDTISVNLFKLLTAALKLRPDRKVILTDTGNFPSDLYVAQGLNSFLDDGHTLVMVEPETVQDRIAENVAVVMVTEVDYRSSRRHDMRGLIKKAHAHGALVIWDLSHSAGAIPVDLMGADADFAVGCTYKYLNGGPGAPAFLFVHPRHHGAVAPALVGWWGDAQPFAFRTTFEAAPGIARYQVGTQPILSMVALDAAMEVWAGIDMRALEKKSHSLCRVFIERVEERCGLKLAGPREFESRGSHVSFHHPHGYAVMQALIASRVIGDFRAPDMIRFGFAPLYNTHVEAFDAAEMLAEILDKRLWDRPEFLQRKSVT